MTGDVHSLDNKGIAQRQSVDPIAYPESQTNAFFFQDREQPGLVQAFPAGIGPKWIGETRLERYIHFSQGLHALVDVLRESGWQQICIAAVAERMQSDLYKFGIHTMDILRRQTGQVTV